MKIRLLSLSVLLTTATLSQAQVGIGTTNPQAFFNVAPGRTVLFGQDSNQVSSESKLIWYATQGAFRAGGVTSANWSRSSATDNTNIGQYSFAAGYNTRASGNRAFATGESSTASNFYATAMGYATTASGNTATALGAHTTASGNSATAMGFQTTASGITATAMGNSTTANGNSSTAMGSFVSTSNHQGSFIIGDYNAFSKLGSDADNQMMMRFMGGYKLFSSADASVGVSLDGGGNAWKTLSDSSRKENFRYADGATFLDKIATMRLGSWNYKGQDVKTYRHYGPMAQEFFAAFGQDALGSIGEDKGINQADFDGVNLIAIQALIKENQELKAKLGAVDQQLKNTQARLNQIEALLHQLADSNPLTYKP